MITGLCILVIVDALLMLACYALSNRDRYRDRDAVPLSVASGLYCAQLLIHVIASLPLAGSLNLHDPGGRSTYCLAVILCGLGPTGMFAVVFWKAASNTGAEAIYGMRTGLPVKSDLSKARALFHQHDIDGALKEYRRIFHEMPNEPDTLFEAAKMLQDEKRFDEAADTLRDILKRFKDSDEVWVRAAFHLGELYAGPLDDKQMTSYLGREIMKRAPRSFYGSIVMARLEPGHKDGSSS